MSPRSSRCQLYAVTLCCTAFVAFLGCSSSSQEAQVSGRVSLDSQQVGPGTVVFAPIAGSGKPATGAVDESGRYAMSTGHEAGLGAGKYKVAVSVREPAPPIKRGDRPPPGKLLIPAKYEDSNTSGLEYDVAPGNNTINIELKSSSVPAFKAWNVRVG